MLCAAADAHIARARISICQTRLRLVGDDEMGNLFEVAVRRKADGKGDGEGEFEEQVLRGMVEDHEVTAAGDVLYLRCVCVCTHLDPVLVVHYAAVSAS